MILMTDTTQALPDVALADQLAELRELAAQLRRQAAQVDQVIARAVRALPAIAIPTATPDQAVVGLTPADIQLPGRPPDASAHFFANWPREGLVLAVMSITGWSLRLDLDFISSPTWCRQGPANVFAGPRE
jgi:hypothetical protein